MKKQIIILLFLFTLCLSLVSSIGAAEFTSDPEEIARTIFIIIFGENFPERWLTTTGFMQFIVFPFIAVFAVMYGIMSELKLFRTPGGRKAQLVISLIMAFVGGYALLVTVRGLLVVNAWLGMILFGLVLFIGLILWAF